MGYQSRTGTPRNLGGRPDKARPKTKRQKRRTKGGYPLEEKHAPTLQEVIERTLNGLHNLGNQRFGLPPFHEHLDRWLMNLKGVLSEFGSNPTIKVDDQFVKERTRILSDIESDLKGERLKEASGGEAIRNLSDARAVLERIEGEYAAKLKGIEGREESEVAVRFREGGRP